LLRLYHGLWTQRVDLQRERAAAAARLARCEKAVGSATDPVREEIGQLDDGLVDLIAQKKVLDERLEQRDRAVRQAADQEPEREQLKAEIAVIADVYRKIAAEVESLNVELQTPPRIRLIETAVPPKPGGNTPKVGL